MEETYYRKLNITDKERNVMKYSYCDDGDSSGVAVGFGAGVEMFFNLASHRQLMFILTQSLVLRKNRNAF